MARGLVKRVPTLVEQPVDGETARDRFLRLAPKRVKQALSSLRVLSNCASAAYQYTPEEAEKIIGTIRARVDEIEAKFLKPKMDRKDPDGFNL
jgi:hypothetical protein